MRKPLWILKLLAGLAVLLAVGAASTRLSVGDGLAQLHGPEAVIAEEALSLAYRVCLDTALERLLIPRMQVVHVKVFGGHGTPKAADGPGAHQVLLRAYTLFGLALGTVRVGAGGETRCEA